MDVPSTGRSKRHNRKLPRTACTGTPPSSIRITSAGGRFEDPKTKEYTVMLMQWKTTPDPFLNDFRALSRQVDGVFRELFEAPKARPTRRDYTIDETDESFSLKTALPGVSPEDLSIEVSDGRLTLSATRSSEVPEGYQAIRRERGTRSFERTLKLGPKVDPEGIAASFDNGILTVTLPKRAEQKPRQISVSAA